MHTCGVSEFPSDVVGVSTPSQSCFLHPWMWVLVSPWMWVPEIIRDTRHKSTWQLSGVQYRTYEYAHYIFYCTYQNSRSCGSGEQHNTRGCLGEAAPATTAAVVSSALSHPSAAEEFLVCSSTSSTAADESRAWCRAATGRSSSASGGKLS